MYFQLTKLENARKDISRDKQTTNKEPVMFFDVIVLTETEQLY